MPIAPASRDAAWCFAFACAALLVAPRAGACTLPVLSEVFYDAVGADDGLVFVEIHGAPGSSLDGLFLEGVNGADGSVTVTLALAGTMPDDGLFVVADDRGDGATEVLGADLVLDFDFQNGPDSVLLRSEAGVLDAVGYGTFGPDDVFAGEGSPAPDAPAGTSLTRRFADVDSQDNAFDFVVGDPPSPGSAAFAAVPEPGSAVLVGLGLAGLARLGTPRRRSRR